MKIFNEESRLMRKGCKERARKVVRGHYFFLVILCLVVAFYGTEFTYVKSLTQSLYEARTTQNVTIGVSTLKGGKDDLIDYVVSDNLDDGKKQTEEQIQEYQKANTTGIFARSNGVLASLINSVSSGHLYMTIATALSSIISSESTVAAILVIISLLLTVGFWVFFKSSLSALLRRAALEARQYPSVPVGHLMYFRNAKRWIHISLTLFLTNLFSSLWKLTIIGGAIKHFSYYLVPYIVAENPDIKARDAINLSRRMMYGHKWECFKMEFSFIGWHILGILTFGVTEYLWSLPYKVATFSEYYALLREEAKQKQLEGSEQLNDTYLFVMADDAQLQNAYSDIQKEQKYIDEHQITINGVRGFFLKQFGLWIGRTAQKREYDDLGRRSARIEEGVAALNRNVYPLALSPLSTHDDTSKQHRLFYLRSYTIPSVVFTFFFISLLGWIWEVSLHIIQDGVFVNRGTMHGPWLPIYGSGAVLVLLLLARFRKKVYVEALAIVVVCACVEYFTSYYLEATRGLRWWDYTGYFLNLNGRICAEGLIVFAIGGLIGVYLIIPLLDNLWSAIKPKLATGICILLLAGFIADSIYSSYVPNEGKGITDYSAYQE